MALSMSTGPIGTNSFIKVKNETMSYHTYNIQSTADLENTVGNVGDLYRDSLGRVWVKGENNWHPYLPVFLVFISRAKIPRWVVKSTIRGRKFEAKETHQAQKRLREEDEEEEDELEVEIIGIRKQSQLASVMSGSNETGSIGDPLPLPAVEGRTDNTWIGDLRTDWNSAPLHYLPRFRDGSMILDALAPTMEHIVADLILAKHEDLNIINQEIGHRTQSHKEQVLVSMWTAAYASSENSNIKLFTIPDIPFHPDSSGKCGIGLVKRFLKLAVTDTDTANDSWSLSFWPPGAITDLHWDYHGGSQIILGISTKKLWLFWHPTEKNLAWWSKHNLHPTSSSTTLETIHNLKGLTFLYQQGQQAFFMPPYHIHAVLTFEVSTHSGTLVWDYNTWKDTARRVTEWEVAWAQDYFENGHSCTDGVWDKLHKKLNKKKCVSKDDLVKFGDWVKIYLKKVEQNLVSMES
ncbi:hypothetical protein PILCRDRAFT_823068 [Piloderma croceum F 1598]|uniref:JmjC domain-containing protein n=1 Tax=Piloderma croceum (strain F 1598) TaxID=765440 RepID=A0A0C3FJB6_PILCF|nr:hypothetical protein PILCRDRAFT_823068 [Piloderma croceum F 1598]